MHREPPGPKGNQLDLGQPREVRELADLGGRRKGVLRPIQGAQRLHRPRHGRAQPRVPRAGCARRLLAHVVQDAVPGVVMDKKKRTGMPGELSWRWLFRSQLWYTEYRIPRTMKHAAAPCGGRQLFRLRQPPGARKTRKRRNPGHELLEAHFRHLLDRRYRPRNGPARNLGCRTRLGAEETGRVHHHGRHRWRSRPDRPTVAGAHREEGPVAPALHPHKQARRLGRRSAALPAGQGR